MEFRHPRGAAGHAADLQRRYRGCDDAGSAGGWRELLSGAGVKSAALSGSGVFRDANTDARARQIFFDGEMPSFHVVIPSFGVVKKQATGATIVAKRKERAIFAVHRPSGADWY